jgi:hypothetical protein
LTVIILGDYPDLYIQVEERKGAALGGMPKGWPKAEIMILVIDSCCS